MNRNAIKDDAPRIAEIYHYYVANTSISFEIEPVSPVEICTRISDVVRCSLPWVVLEENREIIGYAYATQWRERQAYNQTVETTVYLSSHYLGRGFGKIIFSKLLSELTLSGFHTAIGVIALPNEASVRLHETLGFKEIAHLREVWNKMDRWIDIGYWQMML